MQKRYKVKEIDDLIKKYQNEKSSDAQTEYLHELLCAFEGYIIKYVQFLKKGIVRAKDRDLKGLSNMFKSVTNTQDPIDIIQNILINYSYDDVLAQLQLIFIQCVSRYTKQEDGPPFTGFLYAYYKYMIRSWLRELSKDALNTKDIEGIDSKDFMTSSECADQIKIFDHICMNDSDSLTSLEKYILYLSYYRSLKDEDIGTIIGLTRVQVNVIKNKCKAKLHDNQLEFDDIEIR